MSEDRFLDGKQVLFLGYECYDYHNHIRDAIEKGGAVLDYFSVRKYHTPWNYLYWFLNSVSTRLFIEYNRAYAQSILRKIRGRRYDFVFVIQGSQLPYEFYKELRRLNPKARFLNYHWDSVRETEYGNTLLDLIPFFDRVYSFDRQDCRTHRDLYYLPLFYIDDYGELRNVSSKVDQDIDILFIGSLCQYRRYRCIVEIEKLCKKQGLSFYHYMCVSKRFYLRNILSGRLIHKVHSKSLPQEEIANLFVRAKAILDLPHHMQTGLPMRIFEALGAGKKLVTSNRHIVKEPFYDPKNILIIDPDNLSIDPNFIKDTNFIWNNKLEDYSLSNWVKIIFTESDVPL